MTNNVAGLLVAVVDHEAIVKVTGRANFATSVCFKRLVNELQQRGFDSFLLELSNCVTMDSTFLGVLAGTALKLSSNAERLGHGERPQEHGTARGLRLLNPNQRVSELLENLGVADLFPIIQCNVENGTEQYTAPLLNPAATRQELSATCLEAHNVLMQLNPANVARFKDVAQFLAEDIKRLDAAAERRKRAEERSAPAPVGSERR